MADTTAAAHAAIEPVPAVDPRPEAALVNPLTLALGGLWPDETAVIESPAEGVLARTPEGIRDIARGQIVVDRFPSGPEPQSRGPLADLDAREAARANGTWVAGVRWRPTGVGAHNLEDPCAVNAANPTAPLAQQASDAFLIREYESVTAFYGNNRDRGIDAARLRAQQLLESTTSKRIARELWQGELAATRTWSNPFLSRTENATGQLGTPPLVKQVNSGAAVSPIPALAALEAAIAKYGRGDRGVIHCSPRTLMIWAGQGGGGMVLGPSDGTIGLLTTPRGNIIIADAGYTGAPPAPTGAAPGGFSAGGTGAGVAGNAGANTDQTGVLEWAYATGLVALSVSEIDVSEPVHRGDILGAMNNDPGTNIKRSTDDLVVIASRYAAYTFDPAILAGVQIDLSSTTKWSATLP